MSPQRVTIRDVAAAADVSVTTVSDSLSGKGRLPEATRIRVVETAERLGYRASSAAKQLRRGRTGVLLMSVTAPDMNDTTSWNVEFFVRVMSGASEYAFTHGYALAMVPLNLSKASTRVPCDGVLLIDPTEENDLVHRATSQSLPIVTIGRLGDRRGYVDNDIPGSVVQLLGVFEREGARQPALISSPLVTSYTRDTAAAYRAWCQERRIEPIIKIVGEGLVEETSREATAQLLDGPSRPDAILGTLDSIAKGAFAGVLNAGLRVPEDCLIASLTDSGAIEGATVPITALDLDPSRMGAEAARLLIDRVEGRTDVDTPVIVDSVLRERESTSVDLARRKFGTALTSGVQA